jgi:hypothetical protein
MTRRLSPERLTENIVALGEFIDDSGTDEDNLAWRELRAHSDALEAELRNPMGMVTVHWPGGITITVPVRPGDRIVLGKHADDAEGEKP